MPDHTHLIRHPLLVMCAISVLAVAQPARAADPDPDPWWGKDKALHFGLSAGIAGGGYGVGRAIFDRRLDAAILGGSVAIGLGAAKETADAFGFGDPSWKDFTWDVAGTIVGLAIGWGLDLLITSASTGSSGSSGPISSPAPDATR